MTLTTPWRRQMSRRGAISLPAAASGAGAWRCWGRCAIASVDSGRGWRTAASRSQRQSTATERAAQTSRMRSSLSRPSRSTRTPIDTLSSASRLATQGRGTGSIPGSSITSLGSPLMVVVHGATTDRPSRGMATSRLITTTGRRPMSGSSHHQTSPRRGRSVTKLQPLNGTSRGRPTRPPHRSGARRTRRTRRRSLLADVGPAVRQVLGRTAPRRSVRPSPHVPGRGVHHRPWC